MTAVSVKPLSVPGGKRHKRASEKQAPINARDSNVEFDALVELCEVARRPKERARAYLDRVAATVDAVLAGGAARIWISPATVAWVEANPRIADMLTARFYVVDASVETGILLEPAHEPESGFQLSATGWTVSEEKPTLLTMPRRKIAPKVTLRPAWPIAGSLRGTLQLRVHGLKTLRLAFHFRRAGGSHDLEQWLLLSLDRPRAMVHTLSFVEIEFGADGAVQIEFDAKCRANRQLDRIEIEIVEEDNWRMHPSYPGGLSFRLPAIAPAGAELELRSLQIAATNEVRRGPAFGKARGLVHEPYRRPRKARRDAVIFSSWIPEDALPLGEYVLHVLRRWHGDSKVFIGVNHGSSPKWPELIEESGLDVTISHVLPTITMPSDPSGFVAALDAYRRHDEAFNLVWFGHTKGADHLDEEWYFTGRWTIERMFWNRREAIERHFEDPAIGVYSPHYLMLLQNHLSQLDALQRMYGGICQPLGMMAVSTHFVMREENVRRFCHDVDPRFFLEGPAAFGGDRFFFEFAMPNVPIMQGFEPFIERGLGGTSGPASPEGRVSILNDWRQNNAVVAYELEKWRQRPTRFRTLHCEHNRHD